jgi:capsid assembly protease
MPLPKPDNDESQGEFIERCMADDVMREEFEDAAQRRAVCQAQWDDAHQGGKAASRTGGVTMRYPHVINYVLRTPWAILPEKMAVLLEVLAYHEAGGTLTPEEIGERLGTRDPSPQPSPLTRGEGAVIAAAGTTAGAQGTAIAVLPLYGVIAQRANLMTESSGGTSIERFTGAFRQAMADPRIGAVVLDVDSPGGAVNGVEELADEMFRARGSKPVVAVANTLAASAAYWIATAADEIVVTPSGEVGAIGVFAVHEDFSAALEAEGIKVSLISAGKYKIEGNPYEPLGDEARAALQERVDDYYGMFVDAVGRARGVAAKDVREGFGEGRLLGARQAVELGMADRIGTLDDTLDRVARQVASHTTRRAALSLESRQRRLRLAGR